jgi:hypothetical protein
MLKWTARAFALAAALQLGSAHAQEADVESDVELIPPGPAESESDADVDAPPALDAPEQLSDDPLPAEDAPPSVEEAQDEAREDLRDARDAQQEAIERDAIERESRFRPEALPPAAGDLQIDEGVRAATSNLNIDDETRSRYRWHHGEWWFKTRSGGWKFYRDGRWQDFDPTTYSAPAPGLLYGSGSSFSPSYSGGFSPSYGSGFSGAYIGPQTYGAGGGYYYGSRPYATTRNFGVYRPDYEGFDGRYYRGGYGGRVYGNNFYGPGYGYGPGFQGYDPGADRYYGYGTFGRPYSIDGDRYRGGVIGSEIGGRLGGRAGAILGGAIGADAAD